ncbi:MAG: hypothetical protein GY759_06020 [Chloroflexi bacterium]|nr:hypothetical protein [Chloroflexota bacterium]
MNHYQRFFAALNGVPVDRVPLFPLLMYMAADEAGISYRDYASNGRAMAEAQLLVQQQYDLDAITACSDAFRIAADLRPDLMLYPEDKPPYLSQPIVTSKADLDQLTRPDPTAPRSRMGDRALAVESMAKAVKGEVAVLGWVDMPFAEACSLSGVAGFMMIMMDAPDLAHCMLDFISECVIDFALIQIEAGADMIGAGDAASSLISASMFREFALPYEQRVCNAIHQAGKPVKLHICGQTSHLLADMVRSGADLFNVDHLVSLAQARDVYNVHGKCFKGNLDPVSAILESTPERCQQAALDCIRLAEGTRYMLSAGCEIPAETPHEIFRAFCAAPKVAAQGTPG